MNILPIFKSHYSIGRSILTLEGGGKSSSTRPDSIIDICKEYDIKCPFLIDDSMGSFLQAADVFNKENIDFNYGIRLSVCRDMQKKNRDEQKNDWKINILIKNAEAYYSLLKIWNVSSTEGFYNNPRIDIKTLKSLWDNDKFIVLIPFYDSFLFKNLFTSTYGIIPESLAFIEKLFFVIEDNDTIYDQPLEDKILEYTKDKYETILGKSIYYKKKADFITYLTRRCVDKRATLEKPNLQSMNSKEFCAESWKEQDARTFA